jgi:aarF domain-containing kinase
MQVVVPVTYQDYTARRVLTTGWLHGEKLSQSGADDVGKLVNVGVICYLKQLLDTGFFHADPHPGNLIRTPDGRLAILDFGLMTEVGVGVGAGVGVGGGVRRPTHHHDRGGRVDGEGWD